LPPGSHSLLQELNKKSVEIFTEQAESFLKIRTTFAARPCFSTVSVVQGKQEGAYRKFLGEKEAVGNSEGVKRNSR
jgi:5-formaminoimidazole-4-carboxamide-1-beta-D-ribofuranosyl 5'-monophosphate synthetase